MFKNFFSQYLRNWFIVDCEDDSRPMMAMCVRESDAIQITGALNNEESQSASHNNRSDEIAFLKKLLRKVNIVDTRTDKMVSYQMIKDRIAQLRAVR